MKRHWAADLASDSGSRRRPGIEPSLRRSDWRFLIGTSIRARALTGAGVSLTDSARTVATTIEPIRGASQRAPLVVLSNPRRREIELAADLLDPGGCCYIERERPGVGSVWRVRRWLGRAGFTDIQCYWAWPPPRTGSAQFWIPLPGRGVKPYFLNSRSRPVASRRRRILVQLQQLTWRSAAALGSLAPLCVVAWNGRPGPESARSVTEELRCRWTDWGLGPPPAELDCLMLTSGENDLNKITVLAFARRSKIPAVVVKFARTPVSKPGIEHEGRVLPLVDGSRMASVVDIPKLVFSGRLNGVMAVAETAIEGEPLSTSLSRETFPVLAREVAAILAAAVGPEPPVPASQWFERLVAPVAAGFRQRFGRVVNDEVVKRELQTLRSLPDLPLVVEHRDCSPWNVVRTPSGRLAMFDWESAEPQGLPVLDLAYFLVNAVFLAEGVLGSGDEMAAYETTLDGSRVSAAVAAATEEYCSVSGIPLAAWRPLRTFCWMLHACVEHDRGTAQVRMGDLPGTEPPRPPLFLSLWLTDIEGVQGGHPAQKGVDKTGERGLAATPPSWTRRASLNRRTFSKGMASDRRPHQMGPTVTEVDDSSGRRSSVLRDPAAQNHPDDPETILDGP